MSLPLRGVRVIEIGAWVFVPSAAAVLAEWGADVIKVEHPHRGDPMRGMIVRDQSGKPRSDGMDRMNHNKRSIAIDVKHPRGRETLLTLCRSADVFMTSWLTGPRARAGLDVDDIRAVNPSIIYARGSGYGSRGPDADKPSIDITSGWARTGAEHYYAQDERSKFAPFIAPSVGDLGAGVALAGGIAAALVKRLQTGEGSVVDVSLMSAGIYGMSGEISRRRIHGEATAPITREAATNPFVGQYLTADDRVMQLGINQLGAWSELMEIVGRPDLAKDPRFDDAAALFENRVVAIAILDEIFLTRTASEWAAVFSKTSRPWDIVQKPIEVCDDPQVLANNYVAFLERGDTSIPIIRNPVQFDESVPGINPAPDAGEHTDTILAQCGLDWDAIVDLKVSGAIL